jgi:hypothetical protein
VIVALTRQVPAGARVAVSLERAGGSKTRPSMVLFASQSTA